MWQFGFILFAILVIFNFLMWKYKKDVGNFWVVAGLSVAVLFISSLPVVLYSYAELHDTELLNGYVVNKQKIKGTYEESYQCMCRATKDGEKCSTCYRTHYTVTWRVVSTVGDITIKHLDSTVPIVYFTPDPNRYTIVKINDPVSLEHSYINYVKAAPDSLFHPADNELIKKYSTKLPQYPSVFDYYRVNRFITIGVPVNNVSEWNDKISESLKTISAKLQMNLVIVVTNYPKEYFNALQTKWINGKKNDVILVVGTSSMNASPEWVGVMSYEADATFSTELTDQIMDLKSLTPDSVVDTTLKTAVESYHRTSMKSYSYLYNDIDTPWWIYLISLMMVVGGCVGITYLTRN